MTRALARGIVPCERIVRPPGEIGVERPTSRIEHEPPITDPTAEIVRSYERVKQWTRERAISEDDQAGRGMIHLPACGLPTRCDPSMASGLVCADCGRARNGRGGWADAEKFGDGRLPREGGTAHNVAAD